MNACSFAWIWPGCWSAFNAPLWAAGSSWWHYLLWGGLGALLFAPALLSRTRWSESRPLASCVGVSVLAHLLLMIYAYATRLPYAEFPGRGPGDGGVVSLHVLGDDEEFPDALDSDDPPDDSTPSEVELSDDMLPRPENATAQLSQPDPGDAADRPAEHGGESTVPAEPVDTADARPREPAIDAPDPTDHLADRREPRPTEMTEMADSPSSAPQSTANGNAATVRPSLPDIPVPPPTGVAAAPVTAAVAAAAALTAGAARTSTVPESAEIDAAELKEGMQESSSDSPPMPTPSELADTLVQASPVPATPAVVVPPAAKPTTAEVTAVDAAVAADMTHMIARTMPIDGAVDVAPIRPGDGRPVPVLYRNRQASRRLSIALQHGGNANTEAAVNGALEWLARHQAPDGRWDADVHGAGQEARIHGHDRGGAGAHADTGITALAILAFLGAGETHLVGTHREHVQHGLEFLLRNQRTDGELAGSAELFARMYCHGMATLALSEAYAMTGDPRIRPFLERAVRYSVTAQDQATGGWRYRPGDAGDMSQFGWQLMALKSAQQAGLEVPDPTWTGMRRFVDSVASGPQRGLASYRPGERPSRTMTAEALLCRVFLDMHQDRQVKEAMAFVLQELPSDRAENFYYWYYATLAAFQTQGDGWPAWNEALQRQLLARQRTAGDLQGSWDPDTIWGNYGGRVFSTSLGALCLEVYYRYLPMYQTASGNHVEWGERR